MGANYYRVLLGRGSEHAEQCLNENFIGVSYSITQDVGTDFSDDWETYREKFLPIYFAQNPEASKIAAGLTAGVFWKIAKDMQVGDFAVCPMGPAEYRVAEVVGGYFYAPGPVLPHRRKVRWLSHLIRRNDVSDELKRTLSGPLTIIGPESVTRFRDEIERLAGENVMGPGLSAADPTVEDPVAFAMEKHLEDFLVKNCGSTVLGRDFDIYQEGGEIIGQQFETDTGPIDVLAVSKDRRKLLVIELKRGRATDVVVGQVLRYIGFVQQSVAELGQSVEGVVIALEDDHRLRLALSAVPSVSFFRYEISFKLVKA